MSLPCAASGANGRNPSRSSSPTGPEAVREARKRSGFLRLGFPQTEVLPDIQRRAIGRPRPEVAEDQIVSFAAVHVSNRTANVIASFLLQPVTDELARLRLFQN